MIRLATVFSGVGAIEFALKRLNIKHEIIFACDNGERDISYNVAKERKKVRSFSSIDKKHDYVENLYAKLTNKKNYVQMSYLANYTQLNPKRFFQDIVLFDGRDFEGQVDLLVGGSPCQSFSSVGFKGGLNDARGTLFYEYARVLKEVKPKVFIYENVRNVLTHDGGKTWAIMKNIFDKLGYNYKFDILNACDYGIPQNRRRLFVVGIRKDFDLSFDFPPKYKKAKYTMKDFSENYCHFHGMCFNKKGDIKFDGVPGDVDHKYILTPKLYAYVMKSGTKNWYQKPEINLDIGRTLLKTMGNRHRAGVDNYLSFDGTNNLGSVRMLTEREAFRLMGFTDDFKIVVSRTQAYKQAGNSIVVDVLIAIVKSLINCGVFVF